MLSQDIKDIKDRETIRRLMSEFKLCESYETMLSKYEWYSLASGIKNDNKVLKIMKQLKGEY